SVRDIPGEISFPICNLWTIPHAVLSKADYPDEYEVKIGESMFGFYLSYLSQKPIEIQDSTEFMLATMDIGHVFNWVVCKAIEVKVGADVGLGGVGEVNVLKKVGVLRTDACSELFVGGKNCASLLQK